jgi:hypothetical protein
VTDGTTPAYRIPLGGINNPFGPGITAQAY